MNITLYQCAADVQAALDHHFDTEAERQDTLEAVIGQFDVKAQSVIGYIKNQEATEIKADDGTFKASFRKSKAVDVFDEAQIPAEFMRERVTIVPDKTAIKKAIESGQEVAGAKIEERLNLQIK